MVKINKLVRRRIFVIMAVLLIIAAFVIASMLTRELRTEILTLLKF